MARDKRVERLPLCAKNDRDLEVISGHHRVHAATSAGLTNLFIIVDTTGLTRSQVPAKQLANNSIQGRDNTQLLAEIYLQIEDGDLEKSNCWQAIEYWAADYFQE